MTESVNIKPILKSGHGFVAGNRIREALSVFEGGGVRISAIEALIENEKGRKLLNSNAFSFPFEAGDDKDMVRKSYEYFRTCVSEIDLKTDKLVFEIWILVSE